MLHFYSLSSSCSNGSDRCVAHFLQPKQVLVRDLIVDEYIGTGEDRVKNRDGYTEVIGDMLFVIPAIKTANSHRGSSFTQD